MLALFWIDAKSDLRCVRLGQLWIGLKRIAESTQRFGLAFKELRHLFFREKKGGRGEEASVPPRSGKMRSTLPNSFKS